MVGRKGGEGFRECKKCVCFGECTLFLQITLIDLVFFHLFLLNAIYRKLKVEERERRMCYLERVFVPLGVFSKSFECGVFLYKTPVNYQRNFLWKHSYYEW